MPRWRATDRVELNRRRQALDAVAETPHDARMALGLLSYVWHSASRLDGYVATDVAALGGLLGVDQRVLRRLLRLLDAAGLLTRSRGGFLVPDATRLEGVRGAAGGPGFERTPSAALRLAHARLHLSAPVARRRGTHALAALGTFEQVRHDLAPYRGPDRPRVVTAGGRRAAPAAPAAVARAAGLNPKTWAVYAAALVDSGLLQRDGRGHRLAPLTDLQAVPASPVAAVLSEHNAAVSRPAQVHNADGSEAPEVHNADGSTLTSKTVSEDWDQDCSGRADLAQAPDRPVPLPRAGRHGDPKQDADNHKDKVKSSLKDGTSEHPDLAQTVAEIIKTQAAFSALGRPGHQGRAVLSQALHDGVDLWALVDMAVNGGYAWGSRWPAAVLAQRLPAAIAKGRHLDRRREAQARYGSGRPVALALAHDTADECVHGARSCATCPACQHGQPDDLTGQTCRCQQPATAPQQPPTTTDSADPSDWFRSPPQPQTPPLCAHGQPDCSTCPACCDALPAGHLGRLCQKCRYGVPYQDAVA